MEGSPAAAAVNRSTVAAIIPAFCEEKHVGEVVIRTLKQLDHVLVVDDGSSDRTATVAREAGAEVVVHERNLGKGESIKTGLRYWLQRGFSSLVRAWAAGAPFAR